LYFTIRSIRLDDPEFSKTIVTFTDEHIVESGLSSGELRQAILDRLKIELDLGEYSNVNNALKEFGFIVSEDFFNDESNREVVISDIDNVLYETDDEEFNGAVWMLHNEIIEISGE